MNIKEEAQQLIDSLPDDATWDDLLHEIHVRKAIEAGLADSEAGRTVPVEEVRRRFGLGPDDVLRKRAARGGREAYERALEQVPAVEPDEHGRL